MTTNNTLLWQARASFYELFALAFAYPTKELAAAVCSGEFREAAVEIAGILQLEIPDSFNEALRECEQKEEETFFRDLRVEHTRLFVGSPTAPISPYEGVWRAKAEGVGALLFVNPHTVAVEKAMRECGVGSPEGKNEPLDHIATELEFLEYLCALQAGITEPNPALEAPKKGWEGAYESFLEDHACVWIPEFCESVVSQTEEAFFHSMASLLLLFFEVQK